VDDVVAASKNALLSLYGGTPEENLDPTVIQETSDQEFTDTAPELASDIGSSSVS